MKLIIEAATNEVVNTLEDMPPGALLSILCRAIQKVTKKWTYHQYRHFTELLCQALYKERSY